MKLLNPTKKLKELVEKVMQSFRDDLGKEMTDQGHRNTGALLDSLEIRIVPSSNGFKGELWWLPYGEILDQGVKAKRIPFGGKTGAKTSEYITRLIDYFQGKGLQSREAKNAAFATANKQKREGMPTRESYAHSGNGRRTGMLTRTAQIGEIKAIRLIANQGATGIEIEMLKNIEGAFAA